jgi:xanthine dehydrogenase accessory factor
VVEVEGLTAGRVDDLEAVKQAWKTGQLPVLVDPGLTSLAELGPDVLVEATLAKKNTWGLRSSLAPLVIALGPGFRAPEEAHFVIETNRGHNLGRLIVAGQAEANTGLPGEIEGYTWQRVFRSPGQGRFETERQIGDLVGEGEIIGRVAGQPVEAGVSGMIRGLIRPGTQVIKGLKLGDVDPRGSKAQPDLISEKARAIGGSVLECILRAYNT